ncbi:hypothetical protein YPPY13_4702 [Yersinia pestis PY-13]|uniref:Transposase n=1 Tax=Yersinia pestis biovar Orientalis str. IP275 TaxID=373665 RepID=A0AAV3B9N9_YERPE|nr:hypothetical protein YpAngola_A4211 [Yersinia pestis Angola]EDR30726.1 hypothetical protein YPIP275_0746 [Yersinia pestis biovar Orientalis str. IP275]EDR39237.1 hypothetical protein YpF1991016_2263 [Yersinia pestis biovar Orientalis str. F1991016]EDR43802.1 hypothetical protein YpE1979001_3643 [Yersinia pestis biovar Antiqua str. E1979001]EDR60419.1 hypothetical protein YpUG050454_2839 [Yersinia pestis biovar Antiqua str. UG05-0454]EDR65257.1 hypothetical protein YpK1973002_2953 [Yersinia 
MAEKTRIVAPQCVTIKRLPAPCILRSGKYSKHIQSITMLDYHFAY